MTIDLMTFFKWPFSNDKPTTNNQHPYNPFISYICKNSTMTTIKIKVNNKRNARILQKMLQAMTFVKEIESDLPNNENRDNMTN